MTNKQITTEDIKQVRYRWLLLGEASWNYEKMQALGYCYSILPVLKKLYSGDELKKALDTHMQFFNCNQEVTELILGINIAMEEKGGVESLEAVSSIKTGLMGPLAGIGDTLFGVIANTIFFSIGSYMALQGNPFGVFLYWAWAVVRVIFRGKLIHIGYSNGIKLISNMGNVMNRVTEAASVLGLTVVGALVATVVSVKTPVVLEIGEVAMELQGILDSILPALIPVILVSGVYWLLGKKGMTSFKAILLVLLIGVICGATGIIA